MSSKVKETIAGYKKASELLVKQKAKELRKMSIGESSAIYDDLVNAAEIFKRHNKDNEGLEKLDKLRIKMRVELAKKINSVSSMEK